MIGFSVIWLLLQAVAATGAEVSFGEAWNLVRTRDGDIRASQAGIEQARHERESKKDMYLPQINLTGNYLYLDDEVQLGASELLDSMPAGAALSQVLAQFAAGMGYTPDQFIAGTTSTLSDREIKSSNLTMIWPLFTGGRISAAQDAAEAAVREAELLRDLKVRNRFEELSKRYFGLVMEEQLLAVRREVEMSLKLHLDHANLLVENGQIAEVERLQAEVSFDKARVERIKAEEDFEIVQAALNSLLGESEDVQLLTGLFIRKEIPTLEESVKKTLETFPGLALYDSKKKMAAALAQAEKGKYYPEVVAMGNYSLYKEDSLAAELIPEWVVGISVNVPLVDRSGRLEKYRAAQSLEKKIDALRSQAGRDIRLLVEKTYREIVQALAEYNGLGTSQELAQKTVELRQKAFNQGLATSLDVIDASLYVASVKTQRFHAAYNSVTKLAKLLALRGDTSEDCFDRLLMEGE